MKYFVCSFLLFCFACGDKDSPHLNGLPVINLAEGVNHFEIKNLSDYASDIRYVKLEMKEECLISEGLSHVHIEAGKIYVKDWDAVLHVFDAYTGKYLYDIGKKGQGPGELPALPHYDINVKENSILLSYQKITNKFDLEGNFIERVSHPDLQLEDELLNANLVLLEKDLYAAGTKTYGDHQEYVNVIFDKELHILNKMKSYESIKKRPGAKLWHPWAQSGTFFRYRDEVRYFRGISDTIYTYNRKDTLFQPVFKIEYGKHKSYFDLSLKADQENKDLIKFYDFSENERFLFLNLRVDKSPEPFEAIRVMSDGQKGTYMSTIVSGIYDKETRETTFLLQPIPAQVGLKNDLDNGIPFWPKTVSSDNQLVDFHHAYKFLEYAERVTDPDESFLEFVRNCSEEDNPVVIIATSK